MKEEGYALFLSNPKSVLGEMWISLTEALSPLPQRPSEARA